MVIRDIENRRKILFLGAVFCKPSVCLCFGGVAINRFLLILEDSIGVAYFILGMARNLLIIGREFRRKRVGFHTEFTFLVMAVSLF